MSCDGSWCVVLDYLLCILVVPISSSSFQPRLSIAPVSVVIWPSAEQRLTKVRTCDSWPVIRTQLTNVSYSTYDRMSSVVFSLSLGAEEVQRCPRCRLAQKPRKGRRWMPTKAHHQQIRLLFMQWCNLSSLAQH